MEEFARGFPNQHTTHRDTRYICMQTFVSARGPDNEGERGWVSEDEGGNDGARRRLSAITSVRRRLYAAAAAAHVYIFIRVRSVKHACVYIATHACTHDDSE